MQHPFKYLAAAFIAIVGFSNNSFAQCPCGKREVKIYASPSDPTHLHLKVEGNNPHVVEMEPTTEYTFNINVINPHGWDAVSANGCLPGLIYFPTCGVEYLTADATDWAKGSSFKVTYEDSSSGLVAIQSPFKIRFTSGKSDTAEDEADESTQDNTAGIPGVKESEPKVNENTNPPQIEPSGASVSIPLGHVGLGTNGSAPYRSAGILLASGAIGHSLASPTNFLIRTISEANSLVIPHEIRNAQNQLQEVHYITPRLVTRVTGWDSVSNLAIPIDGANSATETLVQRYHVSQYNAATHSFSGGPYITWRMLKHSSSGQQGIKIVFMYGSNNIKEKILMASSSYDLTKVDGNITTTTTIVPPNTQNGNYHRLTEKFHSGIAIAKESTEYQHFAWGYEEVASTVFFNPTAGIGETTFRSYYTNAAVTQSYGKIRYISEPTGNWQLFEYGNDQDVVIQPFASSTLVDPITFEMQPVSGTDGFISVSTTTYSGYISTSRSLYTVEGYYTNQGPLLEDSAGFNSVSSEVTPQDPSTPHLPDGVGLTLRSQNQQTTISFSDQLAQPWTWLAGRVVMRYEQDGSATYYEYSSNAGNQLIVSSTTGLPNADGDEDVEISSWRTFSIVPSISTRTVTVYGAYGVASRESWFHTGNAWTLGHTTSYFYDDMGRLIEEKIGNITISKTNYVSALVVEKFNQSGEKTTYNYSAQGELLSTVKAAGGGVPAMTTEYIRSGLTTTTKVNGVIVQVEVRDGVGRTVSSTDALGISTITTYQDGGRIVTTNRPGGVSSTHTYYWDGTLASISGNAQVNESHQYTVTDQNPANTYLLAHTSYQGVATGTSPRWMTTYSSLDGKMKCTTKPHPDTTSTDPIVTRYEYDNAGRQVKVITDMINNEIVFPTQILRDHDTPTSAAELMDAKTRSGIDIDDDGTLALAGGDRFTETESSYTLVAGVVYQQQVQKNYPTANANEAILTYSLSSASPIVSGNSLIQVSTTTRNGRTITQTDTTNFSSATVTSTKDDSSTTPLDESSVTINGHLQSRTLAGASQPENYLYNSLGQVKQFTDSRGASTWSFYYNNQHQLEKVADQLGQSTTYTYYPITHQNAGMQHTVTDHGGGITETIYDAAGRTLETKGNANYRQVFGYNAYGERTALQTFGSVPATTTWNYDPATGVLDSKVYADNKQTTYTYYADGKLKERTWQRGITTTYTYAPATRDLTDVNYSDTTPDVHFADFDLLGRPHTVTETRGSTVDTTTLTYDLTTGATSTTYAANHSMLPALSISANAPDASGRPTGHTVAQAGSTLHAWSFAYDALGLLHSITSGNIQTLIQFHPGTAIPQTQTTSINGSIAHRSTHNIDMLQRTTGLISEAPDAANGSTLRTIASIGYQFDQRNRRDIARREDGTFWDYGYNDRSEVTSAQKKFANNSLIPAQEFSYDYDGIGNRLAAKYTTYEPNAVNQYTTITTSGEADILARAPGAVTATVPGSTALTTQSANDYTNVHVTADNSTSGKYLTATLNSAAGSVSSLNGKLWMPPATVSPTYDDDGNLLNDGRWIYTYDGENRLILMQPTPAALSAGCPNQSLQFTYDYASRRIAKKVTTGTTTLSDTRFLYDAWNLVAEFSANGSTLVIKARHTWGLDLSRTPQGAGGVGGLLHTTLSSGNLHVCLPSYDGNGNIIAWSDANGSLIQRLDYDPFGNPTIENLSAQLLNGTLLTDHLHFNFSTKYSDSETSLYYYGYRFYDPTNGRWINRDPIEEQGGLNLYGFVGNDGAGKVDLLGMKKSCEPRLKRNGYKNMNSSTGGFKAENWRQYMFGLGMISNVTDTGFSASVSVRSGAYYGIFARTGHVKIESKFKIVCIESIENPSDPRTDCVANIAGEAGNVYTDNDGIASAGMTIFQQFWGNTITVEVIAGGAMSGSNAVGAGIGDKSIGLTFPESGVNKMISLGSSDWVCACVDK